MCRSYWSDSVRSSHTSYDDRNGGKGRTEIERIVYGIELHFISAYLSFGDSKNKKNKKRFFLLFDRTAESYSYPYTSLFSIQQFT